MSTDIRWMSDAIRGMWEFLQKHDGGHLEAIQETMKGREEILEEIRACEARIDEKNKQLACLEESSAQYKELEAEVLGEDIALDHLNLELKEQEACICNQVRDAHASFVENLD